MGDFRACLLNYLKTKINEVIRTFAFCREVQDFSDDTKMMVK